MKTLSELLSRVNLAARLGGLAYGGDRDLYEALGYPAHIAFDDYFARYARQDVAKAVINRPVDATWAGALGLVESDDTEETDLEKAFTDLNKRLGLKSRFARADRLSGLGEYGVLLLGFSDVRGAGGLRQPVKGKALDLWFVKPLSQKSAVISGLETNAGSERYGLPTVYDVALSKTTNVQVHHSRIVHIVGELLEDESHGVPRLQAVFNRLMDLEKVVGGAGEMFWRGARPGYHGKIDNDFQMTDKTETDLQAQINEYEHNLRRILINQGVDLHALEMQVANPKDHVDVIIQMISAETGIPKRILTGSERGELSSAQDSNEWLSKIDQRRADMAEPQIVRPFVDRCIEFGVLPEPKTEYSVEWSDLFARSEKDRADVGQSRSVALNQYAGNPVAQAVVPPEAFFEFFLGLSNDQIELIGKMRDEEMNEDNV